MNSMRVSMSMYVSVIMTMSMRMWCSVIMSMCVGHTLVGASGIILDPFGFFILVFICFPLNWLLWLHRLRVGWLLERRLTWVGWVGWWDLSWLEPISHGNSTRPHEALFFLISILFPIVRGILLVIISVASTASSSATTHHSHPFGYSRVVPVRQTWRETQGFRGGSPTAATEQGACAAASFFIRVIIFLIRVFLA